MNNRLMSSICLLMMCTIQADLVDLGLEISIYDKPLYIGECEERDKLEQIYGKLPLNTIFFPVKFLNDCYYDELQGYVPQAVPYDYIKGAQEGRPATLTINGVQYWVRCRQQREDNMYSANSFEQVVTHFIKDFAKDCHYLANGCGSLKKAQVIDDQGEGHGVNKSPYI